MKQYISASKEGDGENAQTQNWLDEQMSGEK